MTSFAIAPDREHAPLIRKLERVVALGSKERQAVLDLPLTLRTVGAATDVVRHGDRPEACCLVLEGFVCRYKLVADGRRQIMGLYVSGDIPDLMSLHLGVVDHGLGALATTTVASIPHQSLMSLMRRYPMIADFLWRETLIDAAILREWMVRIGRRSAHQRIAHLLCELLLRLKATGLAVGYAYDLPVTQAELGDALGLSSVHVNRILQDLRGERLIALRGGSLTILDWPGLKGAGEFDPAYLYLPDGLAL
jgi:CRP-like cAMP-binding protein